MVNIDTGETGGSAGPWVYWSSHGSAMKGSPYNSWAIRSKDASGNKVEGPHPVFASENGCVMDLDSLKLGWEKEGAAGMAPDRRWNPSISVATPVPTPETRPDGKSVWSRALTVRLAIGGGQAATWEQGAFGAYEAFTRLSKQIMAQWSAHSQNGALLPLVKQVSIEKLALKSGTTNVPILQILKWVPRPDCLKADAPVLAVAAQAPAAAVQAPPAVVATPAAVASVPDDAAF